MCPHHQAECTFARLDGGQRATQCRLPASGTSRCHHQRPPLPPQQGDFLEELSGLKQMSGRPFEAVRADFGRSRRRGWIRGGRVRLGIAPRSPWVIWEPFSEFGILGKNFQSVTLSKTVPGLTQACVLLLSTAGSSRRSAGKALRGS